MVVELDGSGTEQDPFRISCFEELQAVKEGLSAHYELANNIDTSNSKAKRLEPIGDSENPFKGAFDGNNYEIRNLCIKQPEKDYIGIFGCIGEEGRVVNLDLANATVEGKNYVGGLVGVNNGIVESSYTTEVDVSGCTSVGGLVGFNNGKKIESSYSIKSNVSGNKKVGGLVGSNYGTVNQSYTAKVDVSGDNRVGGLVGWNNREVESSYSIKSNVSGDKEVGGLVGWNYGTVNLSYTAKVDVSGDNRVGGLVGLNSTKLLDSSLVLSDSGESNLLEGADVVLSRGNHRISYAVETRILYVQIDDEIYSGGEVSPIGVQSLLEYAQVVKITEKFMTSVVATTQD